MATHRAKKRFGQNFLVDDSVIHSLINAIGPQRTDRILEIGPGLGAMTLPLLARLQQLEVIEIDRDLIARWQARNLEQLIIHQCDALKFDFRNDLSADTDIRPRRLVGNLPYNISTPLIFHILEQAEAVQDMHFMLQKEVVDRLCARCGDRQYGRLAVMVQSRCQTQKLLEIAPESFSPAPKVTSAFVCLEPLSEPMVADTMQSLFAQLVQQAFAQPRKTIANNLREQLSADALRQLDIDPGARPQTISIEQLIRITQQLSMTITE